jgi:hypothetical protein
VIRTLAWLFQFTAPLFVALVQRVTYSFMALSVYGAAVRRLSGLHGETYYVLLCGHFNTLSGASPPFKTHHTEWHFQLWLNSSASFRGRGLRLCLLLSLRL